MALASLRFVAPLALLSVVAAVPAHARAPVFELTVLGELGGDTDTHLSSFLLGKVGTSATLLVDGGSVMPGLQLVLEREGKLAPGATWSLRARALLEALRPVEAALVTHAHLDHIVGLLVGVVPLEIDLALGGHAPLCVVGLPATVEALRVHALAPPLWADFTTLPPGHPALRLVALPAGERRSLGGFQVSSVPLAHPVDSAAFFISSGEDVYLHLGDTGPTQAVWTAARPLVAAGHLRAVAVEVSFPSRLGALAATSGHLTPRTLVGELARLAGLGAEIPPGGITTDAQALSLAARIAPSLSAVTIVCIHIKALAYDEVAKELEALRRAGLSTLVLPTAAQKLRF